MQNNNTNQQKKSNHKKKMLGFVSLLLVILLLMTGTFAWYDYDQHKTNVMSGKGELTKYVTLVEDFDPTGKDVQDWKSGPIVKELSVKNEKEGKAYVRLTLGEFMALGDQDYLYTDLRYMIDQEGNYIKTKETDKDLAIKDLQAQLNDSHNSELQLTDSHFANQEDQGAGSLSHDDSKRIYLVKELDGVSEYYIATRKGDANGQYGKHILLKSTGGEASDIIVGGGTSDPKVRPNDKGVDSQHHSKGRNEDCERYDEIYLDDVLGKSKARDYISLVNNEGGTHVVSLKEYTDNQDDYEDGVWIYIDKESVDGGQAPAQAYIYWSNALTSELQPDSIEREQTANILDKLQLDNAPEGGFEYMMHVDMEAVSHDELSLWTDLPETLKIQYDKEDLPSPILPKCENDLCTIEGNDYKWQILYSQDEEPVVGSIQAQMGIKKGYKLLATDQVLNKVDVTDIPGVTPETTGAVKFHQTAKTFGNGYNDSQLKKVMDNFYHKSISDEAKGLLIATQFDSDTKTGTGWDTRNKLEFAAKPNGVGNTKVFALGTSEINLLLGADSSDRRNILKTKPNKDGIYQNIGYSLYWLRSPSDSDNYAAIVGSSGYVDDSRVDGSNLGARPALWVDFGS